MCGIVGLIDRTGGEVSSELLEAMRDSMINRGPDGAGVYREGPIGMAMRRLSIIDLPGGGQPLWSRNGRVLAFQNGEIYNFKELRRELEATGLQFRTQSDTEVLAHGFAAWGIEKLLDRVDGMFALAILDLDRRELHLARDRYGEKPLFYTSGPGRFAYASTLTALAALPWVNAEWNPLSLQRYLALHYVPGDSTLLGGIRRVLPGERLRVSLEDPQPLRHRYYRLEIDRASGVCQEELSAQIEKAVLSRLVSDVPVGIFLSGGLDSSLIAAISASRNPKISTFSMGFPSEAHDESEHARLVARSIGSSHHHFQFDRNSFLKLLPQVAGALDEPTGDQALLPLYWLCQEARRHASVVLSGEGADEVFAGYGYYRPPAPKGFWSRFSLLGRPPAPPAELPSSLIDNAAPITPSGFPLLTDRAARERLVPLQGTSGDSWEDDLLRWLSTAHDPLAQATAADLGSWLPDDLLVKSDRMTMAHSLEGRAPYLSPAVVECGLRLPAHRKIAGDRTKVALREVARRWLPDQIGNRPKQGFVLPMKDWLMEWFTEHGGATAYCSQHPLPLVRTSALSELVEEDLAHGLRRERLLFAIVLLCEWYDAFSTKVRILRTQYGRAGSPQISSEVPSKNFG